MSYISQKFRVFYDANLSPAAQSARLATVARAELSRLIGLNQFPADYQRFTDGNRGASEDTVKSNGTILYEADVLADAVDYAIRYLVARTVPESSGQLNSGWQVAIGETGRFVPSRQFKGSSLPYGATVTIFNTTPYWRKVETGLIGTRKLKYRIPPDIIEDACVAIRERFSGSVTATRKYSISYTGQQRQKRGRQDLIQAPALVLATRG